MYNIHIICAKNKTKKISTLRTMPLWVDQLHVIIEFSAVPLLISSTQRFSDQSLQGLSGKTYSNNTKRLFVADCNSV